MRRFVEASVLLATVLFATAAVASSPATGARANFKRAGSSIVPAKLVYAPKADFTHELGDGVLRHADVVLKLNVSETGKAENLRIVKSGDPALNGAVLEAVSNYRFRPATLDRQPVPVAMNLTVKVQN